MRTAHLFGWSLAGLLGAGVASAQPPAASDRYVMTAFTNAAQNVMWVYGSQDGLTFRPIAERAYKPPTGLMRDPSVIRKDGWYYVTYTTDWNGASLGFARSRDLKTWEHLTDVKLPVAGVTNTWAPEFFVDEDGSTHIIVSLSTTGINGQFQPHILTAQDATLTRWSAPKPLSGLGPNYIDTFIVRTGGRYHAFVKNETTKFVEHATAVSLEGPWQIADGGDWAGWGKDKEGPAVLRLPDGGWRVFLDGYIDKKVWFSDSHDNFRTWTKPKELPGLSGQARHFTVLDDRAPAKAPFQRDPRITWDKHSLIIDGKRTYIWSGEFQPYRLPSPDLWRDVLQKLKANGYNAISIYVAWGYHSAKPGEYDFSGIRDIDLALKMAKEEGLYVITRTGPYVNAELTRGGFPQWLVNQNAKARTDAPDYVAAAEEWMTAINAVVARNQLSRGGSVIAYQIENELQAVDVTQQRLMQFLHDKAREDGINVPIFHNDIGRNGRWVPPSSDVPGVIHGPTDLYAFDGYPGGSCTAEGKIGRPSPAPDWGWYGPRGARGGSTASPNTPGFTAEFGGGWFDYWGSPGLYACNAERLGPGYARVFYGQNIANGLTIHNIYMGFGGTSWGWLPAPVVFTSYDYGAAIDEARRMRPKAHTIKQMGEFLQAVKDVAEMQPATGVKSPENVRIYHNSNPKTGSHLFVLTRNLTDGQVQPVTFKLPIGEGDPEVTVRLHGQDGMMLMAGYDMDRQRLVYSTSQIQTHMAQGTSDLALLYGDAGDPGETVLRYASAPKVEVLEGAVQSSFDATKGDLKLTYTHQGMARVRISGGGRAPLVLLLADEATAQRFWTFQTAQGPVLAGGGPALVRTARLSGGALEVTGDTDQASPLEVFAPPAVRSIRWNGQAIATSRTAAGSLATSRSLAGPADVALPDLGALTWRRAAGSPEAQPSFDDSSWKAATATRTASTVKPPAGQPVLDMSAYGFHHGDVWYRGRYAGTGSEDSLTIHYGGGGAGFLQVWLDGRFIGQHEMPTNLPRPPGTATATFQIPAELRGGQHTLAVMVRNGGHNWDLEVDDAHKEARGLISASLNGPDGATFTSPIAWKIQGTLGGEDLIDKARGLFNNGGQYGERMGWHLPGFEDRTWSATKAPDGEVAAGTTWYRTSFRLDAPKGHDLSLGLQFGDPNVTRSKGKYRVLIFVNGWHMGQFAAHIGPQRTFVVPSGILNLNGQNTVALAVTSDGAPGNALESVKLVNLRTVRGGVPVRTVPAPDYAGLFKTSARKGK